MTSKRLRNRWDDDLSVSYGEGNVVRLSGPFTTGWRRMPLHACGQVVTGVATATWVDGVEHRYGPGDGFFYPAGLAHCATKVGDGIEESHWAHIGVATANGADPLLGLEIPRRFTGRPARRVGAICTALAGLRLPKPTLAQTARRQALLYELVAVLAELGQAHGAAPASGKKGREDPQLTRLGPAIELMRQFIADPLKIPELARAAGLSVPRFHVVFKELLGVSPHQYLQQLRLELARRLLERGDEPVKVVAKRAGFPNEVLLYRHFRRAAGQSPRAYRRSSRMGSS